MRPTGNTALRWLALVVCLLAGAAQAAVSVSVDRNRVALGESLRLTITSSGGEELSDAQLQPLRENFEILQRSTSSQTRIVNGQRSHTTQLLVDLAPLREGELQIPRLRIGGALTEPVPVTVSAAPDTVTGGDAVLFEAEVDRDEVYVQGQILLTLRVMQAVNLEGRSISELELEDAFVKPLEQKSFQRTIDGRPWLVHEIRYAIFPEQSGTLEIPPQVFTGREVVGRRSFFDFGSGRRLRRVTEPVTVEVLPRPDAFPGDTWLPARNLTVTEEWSTPPETLRAGESATRTLRIEGEGLQGAQLPPVHFTPLDGVKFYPDQPEIGEVEVASGLLGRRRDSAAIVPTRGGRISLPEIRIPWWDTQTDRLRWAVVAARDIDVAAAAPAAGAQTAPAETAATRPEPAQLVAQEGSALPWQALSAFTTLGWLLTLAWLLRRRGARAAPAAAAATTSERRAFAELRRACAAGDAVAARRAIPTWAQACTGDATLLSLQAVAAHFGDDRLRAAFRALDDHLYGRGGQTWNGADLFARVKALRAAHGARSGTADDGLALYPQPG